MKFHTLRQLRRARCYRRKSRQPNSRCDERFLQVFYNLFGATATSSSQQPNVITTNQSTDFDEDVTITHVEEPGERSLGHNLHVHNSTTSEDVQITGVGINEPNPNPNAKDNDQIHTKVNIGTKCPYTKRTMVNPVRNKICGHNYERVEIIHYILTGRNPRCPISGCKNQMRLQLRDLEENQELKTFIQNLNAQRPKSHATITTECSQKNSSIGLLNKGKSGDLRTGYWTANKLPSQSQNQMYLQEHRLCRTNHSKTDYRRSTFFSGRYPSNVQNVLGSFTSSIARGTALFGTNGSRSSTIINGNDVSSIRKSHSYHVDDESDDDEYDEEEEDDDYEDEDEDDDYDEEDKWNNVEVNDCDKNDDEESERSFCEYGSEMDDDEPVEHNHFDFTDDENGLPDIYCECDECKDQVSEEDNEDGDEDDEESKSSFSEYGSEMGDDEQEVHTGNSFDFTDD